MPKPSSQSPQTVEVVDPRWLGKMLGIMLVVALLCGYIVMGFMVYLGSWQLVIHPTRLTNSGTGLASERIQFAPDGTGKPQLHGEWLAGTSRADYAVLYLRSADGQLDMGDGSQIRSLHATGLSVLAFDYRGFGESAARPHPSEDRMLADAVSAWEYLTATRHIQPDHILVFGTGAGVSIGTQLLQKYGPGAALIAYNADPSVVPRVRADGRAKLYPLHLVFHDAFPLEGLQHLRTPKLLYTVGPLDKARAEVYKSAADPKLTVEVPTHDAAVEDAALRRFLDTYLPGAPIPTLQPTGAK